MRRLLLFLLLLPGLAQAGLPVPPASDPSILCERAVTATEITAGTPPRLLQAISLTESSRLDPRSGRARAWPWTINAEGEGHFFETRQDAVAAVRALQARGVRSIDVGCMQVNLMYHPDAFASVDEAFDPYANVRYAARFLKSLYADSHDWQKAIAAYHSETPALGDAYRVLVLARWQKPSLGAQGAPAQQGAYQDFPPVSQMYGAFAQTGRAYGAFSRNH